MTNFEKGVKDQNERVDAFFDEFHRAYIKCIGTPNVQAILNYRRLATITNDFFKTYTCEARRLEKERVLGLTAKGGE